MAIKDHTYPQNRSSARLYDPSLPKRLPDLFKVAPVSHFLIHHLNIQGTVEDAKMTEMPSTSWSQRDKTVSQIFPYSCSVCNTFHPPLSVSLNLNCRQHLITRGKCSEKVIFYLSQSTVSLIIQPDFRRMHSLKRAYKFGGDDDSKQDGGR